MLKSTNLPPIILVGHRTSGKSVLGPILARLLSAERPEDASNSWRFVDLDGQIEAAEGATPTEIIARDRAHFRRLESTHLQQLLATKPADAGLIVTAGAGFEGLSAVQANFEPLIVWIWRDGWEISACTERARLRPEMSFEEEVAWMRKTREPRWAQAAHLFFEIPRGRTPDFAAEIIADHLRWALQTPHSTIARRSWMVPGTMWELGRALGDSRLFGLAGVEVRSDIFDRLDIFDEVAHTRNLRNLLASLRNERPDWLRAALRSEVVGAIDIDQRFLPALIRAGIFEDFAADRSLPRRLILSTHPAGVGAEQARALLENAALLRDHYPDLASGLELKYAPSPANFVELDACFKIARVLCLKTLQKHFKAQQKHLKTHPKRSNTHKNPDYSPNSANLVSFLPQGRDFAWTRVLLNTSNRYSNNVNHSEILAAPNGHNYLPVGLRPSRHPALKNAAKTSSCPVPMDLQDWLPYLGSNARFEHFDALIGDPVEQSLGDWWHIKTSENDNTLRGNIATQAPSASTPYLKIRLPKTCENTELHHAFLLLATLGVRGLSITSPLKARVAQFITRRVDLEQDAPLNTLVFAGDRDALFHWQIGSGDWNDESAQWNDWIGTDTDEIGMSAALTSVESLARDKIKAKTVAIIGRGAVTPAVRRALKHGAWHLVCHASARAGWPEDAPSAVDLIINAAGPGVDASTNAPEARVWIDLHYQQNQPLADDTPLHLNGDVFFVAQARAQREFWAKFS